MFYKKKQQHKYAHSWAVPVLLFFLLLLPNSKVFADNLTSPGFQIENSTIDLGGGLSSSTNFKLISSIGELGIGESSALNFIGHIGFLYFPEIVVPPPTPPGGGGGGGGGVESTPTTPIPGLLCRFSDFNCDGLVNIEDLSILLYYSDKTGNIIKPYDLNEDGMIDIRDISIMFYYWDL